METENAECRNKMAIIEEEVKKLEGEMREIEGSIGDLQKEREGIEARKKRINDVHKEMETMKLRLGESMLTGLLGVFFSDGFCTGYSASQG